MTGNRTVPGGLCPIIGVRSPENADKGRKGGLARFLLYVLRMTNQTNRSEIARCLMADAGSVMMEYVVLLVFIVVGIASISNREIYDYSRSSFGSLGSQIVHFYQQLQGGLSLPVP